MLANTSTVRFPSKCIQVGHQIMHIVKPRLNPLLTLLFFPAFLFAQGVDIRGTVADSVSGEKIPYANVMVVGTSRGAASNLQGFYLIANVPPGRYQISASTVGHQVSIKSVEVRMGNPMIVNFELAPKDVQMSEVMVTGAAKRELSEIQTSVHILEQRDMKAVPVAAQEDVFRSIEILPGIVSTSDVSSQFYVRGGAGDQNLILLDGMNIYNPYHAFGIFSIFDSDVLKTTDVYTGAYPAEYGGRLSSVVNMTTLDGGAKSISGHANINFLSGKVQLDGPLPVSIGSPITWLVSVRKSLFSETFTKFLNKDLPLSFFDGFAKVTFRPGETEAKYGFEIFSSGDDLKSTNPTEPDYSWRTSALGFTASGLIGDRAFVTAAMFMNRYVAERDAKQSNDIASESTSVYEPGMRVNATIHTDSDDLFFLGLQLNFPMLDYSTTNNFGVAIDETSHLAEGTAWVKYQTAPSRLQADLGLCLDVGSLMTRTAGIEIIQPRVSLSYGLWDTWKAKAAVGRFTQNMITVNNEDDLISIFNAWIEVPEGQKSETSDHYVLGLEGNVLPTLSTNFQTYYKTYGRLLLYNQDKIDAYQPDYITGTGKAYGLESLIRYGSDLADLYVAYTLGWTTVTSNGITYCPRYDRRHTLNLLSVIHAATKFDVSLRWSLGSGLPFTETVGFYDRLHLTNLLRGSYLGETGESYVMLGSRNARRLPTFHQLDASATYRFVLEPIRGTVGVNIVNVYNQKNIFYVDRKTSQQVNMLPFFPTATLNITF